MRGNLTARNVSMIQKFSGVAGRAKWCAWPGGAEMKEQQVGQQNYYLELKCHFVGSTYLNY